MSQDMIGIQTTRYIEKLLIRISLIIRYRKYSWEQISNDWILIPAFQFQICYGLDVNKRTLQITQIQIHWKHILFLHIDIIYWYIDIFFITLVNKYLEKSSISEWVWILLFRPDLDPTFFLCWKPDLATTFS